MRMTLPSLPSSFLVWRANRLSQHKPLIAVVDDDESVCRALRRLVHSLGMEAETFASGTEFIGFIEAAPSFHANCIVLDLHMQGLNGLDVQARLAASRRPFPIVFITAHDDEEARDSALAGGAIAFLRKPFSDEMLINALNQAIHGRSRP